MKCWHFISKRSISLWHHHALQKHISGHYSPLKLRKGRQRLYFIFGHIMNWWQWSWGSTLKLYLSSRSALLLPWTFNFDVNNEFNFWESVASSSQHLCSEHHSPPHLIVIMKFELLFSHCVNKLSISPLHSVKAECKWSWKKNPKLNNECNHMLLHDVATLCCCCANLHFVSAVFFFSSQLLSILISNIKNVSMRFLFSKHIENRYAALYD